MGSTDDIKLLEERLRLAEEELAGLKRKENNALAPGSDVILRIFHSAAQLMAISNLETGEYVDVNDSFLSSLEYSRDEIIGHTSDDIQVFTDFEESSKYIRIISRLKKVKDFPVTLKSKSGKEKSYLFSAETISLDNRVFMLTIYNEVNTPDSSYLNNIQGTILSEIVETVSSYFSLYRIGEDNSFHILDLSSKVEEVESVSRGKVLGKCISDTPLAQRPKLMELLQYIRITGDAHKLAASQKGDDSEGYYMGFLLSSGRIVITWEPGSGNDAPARRVHERTHPGSSLQGRNIYAEITSDERHHMFQEVLFNISTAALKQSEPADILPVIVQEIGKIWDTNNFFIGLYDSPSDSFILPYYRDENDSYSRIPARNTLSGWVLKNNKSLLASSSDIDKLVRNGEIERRGSACRIWMGQDDLYVLEFIANQVAIVIQRKRMLDDLIIARQKAEMAAHSKQLFMSTMSHEIRTPLNEVIGITNLLLQGNPREDQMDFIKTLKFSGNHLLTLVNDVLDYNKLESGKISFENVRFNLLDFLDEIVRSYSLRSKVKNLKFSLIKQNHLPEFVTGDPVRLNQIISNLLSNALKFTNEGGITVEINEISRSGSASEIEFRVSDTGIGIPSDKHSVIFDSYAQASTDTTRFFGGTGLGLSICKKLVELQGGTISVASEPGKGSVFTFLLKFRIDDLSSSIHQVKQNDSFTGLEGKKILVAEDNKINFFVANKFLTGWGMNVTHVETGQAALEMLEKEDFDLVLMDLHMPVMDGIEATRIIRNSANPKIKDIPVVALTAAIMSENHDKIEDLTINDYVLKPFKPNDLFERIRRNIKKST
ncbi:MAG: ATP-binding protein, partial [Bacteroidales bacterium]|nr:ATP-binding protein [Bacteroidales bacterium]